MAPPFRSDTNPTEGFGGGENQPSVNLWIGNLSSDISEAELKALLEKHGEVESITSYSSRNYAFVYFKKVEDAKSAKEGLQGYVLRGNALKIEFAKSARPCKTLWVAGISPSVPKDELEKKFLKFGQIQEFRFLKDRSTAYVDYVSLDDATEALKDMNGKRIGGSQLRVDYLRSLSSRREHGQDAKAGLFPSKNTGLPDFLWMGHDNLSSYPEPSFSGANRINQPFVSIGSQKGDSPLSNVLLIRHPPSLIIEEDMLHNAMILFGEIEKIKTFSDRNYAFVEFRSAEEARRAKEGLQGKLFNDPRISIEFFTTEFPGVGGQAGDYSIQAAQMDMLGLNTGLPPLGFREPDLYVRPSLVPHSNFRLHGPEYIDLAAVHKLQNTGTRGLIGEPNWGRSSPTHGISTSAKPILNVPKRSASGSWDLVDGNMLSRDSKRTRFEAGLHPEIIENQGGLDEQYGRSQINNMGALGSRTRSTTGGLGKRHSNSDCIWQGLIAKGGTPVCHARCVAVSDGFDADIPKVVNCSARTGLDLLAKHYEDAIGFDIVFFLPDSEDDFASYTEFLRYLSSKDRAGVAKFDDGTALFLVPPSTFLSQVLKVSGPERLYGVVLKFPPVAPSSTALNSQPIYPPQADPHNMTMLQTGYSNIPTEGRVSPLHFNKVLAEESTMLPRSHVPVTSSFPAQSVPSTTAGSQVGLTLTPELIATLTSFLPGNNASGSRTNPPVLGTTSNLATGPDTNVAHWNPEHQAQAPDQNGQLVQLRGGQFSSQLQHLQTVQAAPVVSNPASNFNMTRNPYNQVDDQFVTLTQAPLSSNSYAPVHSSQSGPVSVVQEGSQHHQQGSSYDVYRGQAANDRADAQRFYNSSVPQQTAYPVSLSNQVHASGVSMPQPYTPVPSEVVSHQSQPIQASQLGAVQEQAESEADKNERYKTTLLFAANLLSQIHQPSSNQPGPGAGSHRV